jgi:hypothetical protein
MSRLVPQFLKGDMSTLEGAPNCNVHVLFFGDLYIDL